MLRGFGHVVVYLALEELRQNALRGSATVKALLAVQRIAIDRFALVEANVWAIYLILEGRRQELRNGGLPIARAAFQGFAALIGQPIADALDAPAKAAQRP